MTPEALAALHALCFDDAPRPWSAAEFDEMLAARHTRLFADDRGRGFLLARIIEGEAEVLTLCTHPDARRGGVARTLVTRLEQALGSEGPGAIFLEVAETNAAARALYAGLGFAEAGYRKSYYHPRDGRSISALVLRRSLD